MVFTRLAHLFDNYKLRMYVYKCVYIYVCICIFIYVVHCKKKTQMGRCLFFGGWNTHDDAIFW